MNKTKTLIKLTGGLMVLGISLTLLAVFSSVALGSPLDLDVSYAAGDDIQSSESAANMTADQVAEEPAESPVSAPDNPTNADSATLYSSDNFIMDLSHTPPGDVFVLDNREVVTELPPDRQDHFYKRDDGSYAVSEPDGNSFTMTITAAVLPSRLIVVDDNDRITEIWSNTTGLKYSFYSLRLTDQQDQEHPLTQEILAQYNRLLGKVDWSVRGQAYAQQGGGQ